MPESSDSIMRYIWNNEFQSLPGTPYEGIINQTLSGIGPGTLLTPAYSHEQWNNALQRLPGRHSECLHCWPYMGIMICACQLTINLQFLVADCVIDTNGMACMHAFLWPHLQWDCRSPATLNLRQQNHSVQCHKK